MGLTELERDILTRAVEYEAGKYMEIERADKYSSSRVEETIGLTWSDLCVVVPHADATAAEIEDACFRLKDIGFRVEIMHGAEIKLCVSVSYEAMKRYNLLLA